jgi:hypothetical protein
VSVNHILNFSLFALLQRFSSFAERGAVEFLAEFFPPLIIQIADFLCPRCCSISRLVK